MWQLVKGFFDSRMTAMVNSNRLYRLGRHIDNISLSLKFPFGGDPVVMLQRIHFYILNQQKAVEYLHNQNRSLHARISEMLVTPDGKNEVERRIDAYNQATVALRDLLEREEAYRAENTMPAPVTDPVTDPVTESTDELAQRIMENKE